MATKWPEAAALAWARGLFEAGGVPVARIAAELSIEPVQLRYLARRHGWRHPARRRARACDGAVLTPPRTPPSQALVGRLFAAFEKQLADLEARRVFTEAPTEPAEPDARVLGAMAKTLETLFELDRAVREEGGGAAEGDDADALRTEIARRLERLRGG